MDKQEQVRMDKIHSSLEKQFNEQLRVLEPVIIKLLDVTQKASNHVFRIYRSECKASFEELEKYATIGQKSDIIVKNPKDQEKAYVAFVKVMDCIFSNDKDFEKASKSLDEIKGKLSEDYDICNFKCSENSKTRSDQEISDCFLNCNQVFINDYKGFSQKIADDYSSVVMRIEKL